MRTLTLSILFLMLASAAEASVASLRLVDAIAVTGPEVELGEIATVECEDPTLKKRLLHLAIADAPTMGSTRIISSFRIQGILEKSSIEDVEILGSQTVVSHESREVGKEELKAFLRKWVDEGLSEGQEAELRFNQIPSSWEVPAGDDVQLCVSHTGDRSGKLTLNVQAKVDGRIMANTRVRMEADVYQMGYAMIRPLQRGENLTRDHLEYRRVLVSDLNGMDVAQIDDVIGLIAKRNLAIGHVPKVTDFDIPVAIERGSMNRLLVENGTIRLSMVGAQALQDGRPGELILFSNPMNSKEPLRGRVIRPGLAVIKIR